MHVKSFIFLLITFFTLSSSIHAFEENLPDDYELVNLAEEEIEKDEVIKAYNASFKGPSAKDVPDCNLAMETLESGPSSVVAGCVNVITGDFFESYAPMTIPGAQPLAVQCSYCSSEKKWNFLHMPELVVGKSTGENHLYARYFGDNGSGITYRAYTSKNSIKGRNLIIPSTLFEKGLTNCGSGIISGQTNWKNSSVSMIRRCHERAYMLTHGSGINRIFTIDGFYQEFKGTRLGNFRLESENYSNGNRLLYEYEEGLLKRVKAVNSANQTLAHISLSRDRHSSQTYWISGTGENIAFQFADSSKTRIKKIVPSHAACVSYSYNKHDFLEKKEMPEGRFLKVNYFGSGKAKGRVSSLKTAMGLSYNFYYNVDLGETYVNDAKQNLTKYCYDKKTKRLQSIKRYEKTQCFLNQENYFWYDSKDNSGNLKAKTFEGDGKTYFCRYLEYDDFGNVKEDRLFGNLTGKSLEPLLLRDGYVPVTLCDVYIKTYQHTQDERNLLLVENDGKKIICCDYHPNRLLKTRLTTNTEGKILKREFFEYDGNGVLTIALWDDGQALHKDDLSYVTERHLKMIYPRAIHPIGLPQIVEEYYMDMASGQYHLLKKIVNEHSPQGKIKQEDHYGSDGNFAYRLTWDYDDLGNVKKKSDPLGQTITFTYDGNSNKLSENGPRSDWRKEFQYDLNNRLIEEIEYWAGGTVLKTTHAYNSINQKIATTDPFGQVTTFEYNALGHLLKIQYPPLFNGPQSVITPFEETTYDAMGNAIVQKNGNGHITKASYTLRGQPYRIEHPDGSIEQKEYSLSGLLVKEIARNGIVTTYAYDSFDRIIAIQITDLEGIQKTTTSTYSTFNLLAETDEEGTVTTYEYDGAGRRISMRKRDHLTQYQYDSLGRIIKTIESIDGTNVRITCKEYDLLDRVIEKRIEDAHGEVFKKEQCSYDVDGNKASTALFTQAGIAKTETEYHPDGKPFRITDALGNQTLYFYDHAFSFKGQTVLKMTKIDPLGNQEFKVHDIHGNVCCQIKIDPCGSLLQSESSYYDALGQKIHSQITVYQGQEQKRIIETLWEYDAISNLVQCIEALGTPDQKTVRHHYNKFGQKEKTEMPNGISILNTYDSLGRLSTYKSTDNTIHYQYTYDKKDRPLLVKDLIHNTATELAYDEHGRLTSETFDNGLTLSYTYDQLDRPVTVTLPDQSSIRYHYNAQYLIAIERVQEDAVIYTHNYDNYDLAGNVTKETLLGQAGNINYQYDLLERPISVQAPHWESIIPQTGFDAIGNLLERKVADTKGPLTYTYAYDNLNQLISENGFVSHTYQHDSVYNRTAKNDQPYDVNVLNQLLSQTNCAYRYDGNGNLIEKTVGSDQIHYVYDALDRLIEVHNGSDITTYIYDSFHRRLSKTRQGLTTYYLYQNKNEIGAFSQGKMAQLRILGISYGAEIGGAVALELDGKTYATIHDSHGNVVALLDFLGNLVEGYRYTAFGETEIFSEKALDNPWRYSSKRLDAETGFLFFGRRYYSPEIGRWTTPDPVGYADGPNLYAYVHNHPIAYIDPDGRFGFPIHICAHSPQQLQANVAAFASNSYVQGMMQATGGLTEACIGSGVIIGSGGLGCVPGAIVTAHGLDNYIAGMNKLMTGKPTETVTSQLLQSTGLSSQTASLIDSSLSMVGTIGGTAILRANAPVISNSFKLPETSLIGIEGVNQEINLARNVFPRNPKDLLPDAIRDRKGYIYACDRIRIKPEKHVFKDGDIYNPRHHELHYHVEIKKDPFLSWKNEDNAYYLRPENYKKGMGTGFLPDEKFP